MKQFKAMAETARDQSKCYKYQNVVDEKSQTIPMTRADLDTFWKRYEEAKVFVFDTHSWPMPAEGVIKTVATDEPELDIPFQTCAFESLTGDGKDWLIEIDDGKKFHCILLHEVAPRQYDLYATGGSNQKFVYIPWEAGKGNPLAWLNVIWLNRLNEGAIGIEHVRDKLKIGSGKEKRFHTIRQVIRVVPKTDRFHAPAAFSREIDWSHRWAVRGHWRQHNGLGKNRAGEYCVQGFTWVNDHVRGPEDAPLINKTRIVTTPKNADVPGQ